MNADKAKHGNESLIERITIELKKTGYPTEILSGSIMEDKGWKVLHNPSYLDEKEGLSREFDLRAYKSSSFQTHGQNFTIGVYLVTECKKSEKPWVFFVTPEIHDPQRTVKAIKWHAQVNSFNWDPISAKVISYDELSKMHHYFSHMELARTYYEPFKGHGKSDSSQMIYAAILSCVKATLFHYLESGMDRFLAIYYPLIVFSGQLFKAHVNEEKEISVEEVKHLQLDFSYIVTTQKSSSSIWESQHRFLIDIVHEDYLSAYVDGINTELASMSTKLKSSMDAFSAAL